jgi:hypothetical protein
MIKRRISRCVAAMILGAAITTIDAGSVSAHASSNCTHGTTTEWQGVVFAIITYDWGVWLGNPYVAIHEHHVHHYVMPGFEHDRVLGCKS